VIDIEKLGSLVAFFAEKGHPIIVVLNYGTTFKGAYDDAGAVGDALEPILKKHGLIERQVQYDSGRCDLRRGYWMTLPSFSVPQAWAIMPPAFLYRQATFSRKPLG
jgi:hypothetical protein